MQNNTFISREKMQGILDSRPKGMDAQKVVDYYVNNGYIVAGINDQPKQVTPTRDILSDIKSKIDTNTQKVAEENINTPTTGAIKALGDAAGIATSEIANILSSYVPQSIKDRASSAYQSAVKATDISDNPLIQKAVLTTADNYNALPQEVRNVVEGGAELASTVLPAARLSRVGGELGVQGALKSGESVVKAGEAIAKVVPVVNEKVIKPATNIATGMTSGVTRTPGRIMTNIAEKQATEQAIKELPSKVAQNAVRDGVDIVDAKTLLSIPITKQSTKILNTVKQFAEGNTKIDPISVVGEPLANGIKIAESITNKVGAKLGEASKNIGILTKPELTEGVFNSLKKVSGLENLKLDKANNLDFKGTRLASTLSKADRNAISEAFRESIKWGDGEKAHMFRQTLFENLGGKKKSLQNITDTQEKAINAIRAGLSDVISAKSPEYATLSKQYAKAIEPITKIKKLMKATGDVDIDSLSAGLLARRITSAAASNPEIRNLLNKLDNIIGNKNISTSIKASQDLYNILNKYYDIAPKTGFQNLVKEGTSDSVVGVLKNAATDIAGKSNVVRQKALEDLFNSLK